MKRKIIFYSVSAIIFSMFLLSSCGEVKEAETDSGITKTTAQITTGADGLTIEQRNIKNRLEEDNDIGSIKHLYVISAYSGQVLIYSTVDGKVTSSGKRLTPKTVNGNGFDNQGNSNFINIGGTAYTTNEMIEEDGTFGSSIEYIYWFDKRGAYHQHYITGGQILHISNQPLAVKEIVVNMEIVAK